MRLVADIGGTNTRLALVPSGSREFGRTQSYRNADFNSFDDVISKYLSHHNMVTLKQLVVAMAGPVKNDVGRLTNLDWVIDRRMLSSRFGGVPARVINDLTALGHAALQLTPNQIFSVSAVPAPKHAQRQALVVGIGTGFNVSPIVENNGTTICAAVEAGHTTVFASICSELERLKSGLSNDFSTVESLFSGRGRRKFLSLLTGVNVKTASPYIARQGCSENAVFDDALDRYAVLIGMLLAEFKVAYLPHGGIFLAGGVARSSLIGNRSELCAKAAMQDNHFIKSNPPIWAINDDVAALVGCASLDISPSYQEHS